MGVIITVFSFNMFENLYAVLCFLNHHQLKSTFLDQKDQMLSRQLKIVNYKQRSSIYLKDKDVSCFKQKISDSHCFLSDVIIFCLI